MVWVFVSCALDRTKATELAKIHRWATVSSLFVGVLYFAPRSGIKSATVVCLLMTPVSSACHETAPGWQLPLSFGMPTTAAVSTGHSVVAN